MRLPLLAAATLAACQPVAQDNGAAQRPAADRQPADPNTPVSSADPGPAEPTAPIPDFAGPSSDCPILGSREWAAWINAMPGPGARPTLIVSGKVRVPSGGYRIAFSDMRVAESYPVQIFLDLEVTPPPGPATQAVTMLDVRGQWPVAPPVGSVSVRCGARVLMRIADVETAH